MRQKRTEVSTILDMSGSLSKTTTAVNAQGFSSTMPYIVSPFLTASKIDVGYPESEEFKLATGTMSVINYNQVVDGKQFWLTGFKW